MSRKYNVEHKCEWNLSLVVLLFLAVVTFYLNCLDRIVLAHPFWTLATFPFCFSVLSCRTNRTTSVGTNGPVGFGKKKHTICKKQYMYWMMIILCQWDLNEHIENMVRMSLYTSKNCWRTFHIWVHFVRGQ